MLIKCNIQRDGDTEVTINRFKYIFKHNKYGDSVCDVLVKGDREYLLRQNKGKDFVIYEPKQLVIKNKHAEIKDKTTKSLMAVSDEVLDKVKMIASNNLNMDRQDLLSLVIKELGIPLVAANKALNSL